MILAIYQVRPTTHYCPVDVCSLWESARVEGGVVVDSTALTPFDTPSGECPHYLSAPRR